MAELDQNYAAEQAHGQEYEPEHEVVHDHVIEEEHAHADEEEHACGDEAEHAHGDEAEHAHGDEAEHAHGDKEEHAHGDEAENAHENEVEHSHETEVENVHENDVEHAHENENETTPADVIPENSDPDVKQDHVDELVAGGGERWPGWPGETIFRMLVPAQKVGSIIGRKGEYIKKTCEETKARIKILDGPPGTRERAVMVSAKEEPDAILPPAIDGLLRVLRRVVDGLENDSSEPPTGSGGKVSIRLLVPAPQAGSLIGKQGATVKSIQEESNCIVRVLGSEDLPVFALQDDRVVEVVGEPAGTQKAIELIASHLRKFLVDRSIISIIEMQMQMPNSQMDHMPPSQHWGPPPQSYPQHAHSGPYGASPHFMPPQQFDNYYPPADMQRPTEKPTHQGISAYGREAPVQMHSSSSQAAPSVITQVTQQMQIPLTYADAVIGTQGASISYIRRVSGATVAIQETRGLPTEMTVEISGTASQVQTAQQLIQNFMAEAAAGAAQTQHAPSAEQAYNTYGGHGSSVYASNASNPSHGGQSGGYGQVYGNSYGY